MDIYKWAEDNRYLADYYDFHTGNIYKVMEYAKERQVNPDARIKVVDSDGNLIGYAKKKGD